MFLEYGNGNLDQENFSEIQIFRNLSILHYMLRCLTNSAVRFLGIYAYL